MWITVTLPKFIYVNTAKRYLIVYWHADLRLGPRENTRHKKIQPQQSLVYNSSPSNCATPIHDIYNHSIVSHSTSKLTPKMISFFHRRGYAARGVILTMHIMLRMASGQICWVQAFRRWRGYGTVHFWWRQIYRERMRQGLRTRRWLLLANSSF